MGDYSGFHFHRIQYQTCSPLPVICSPVPFLKFVFYLFAKRYKQAFVGGDRFYVVGRLTFTCSDGVFYQEATGTERLDCSNYGDPSSNAEAMAFRRCASKFGLGLSSYFQR